MSPVYGLTAPEPPCFLSSSASSSLMWATMVSSPRPLLASSLANLARSASLNLLKSIWEFCFLLIGDSLFIHYL